MNKKKKKPIRKKKLTKKVIRKKTAFKIAKRKKAGRKKIKFTERDRNSIEQLVKYGSNVQEIAKIMSCSKRTLMHTFAEVIKKGTNKIRFTEKEINSIEQLATCGCPNDEIAAVMKCSWDTLERNFADRIKIGRDSRNASLRLKQYQVAIGGDKTMLIWLGKNYLGQTDKMLHDIPFEKTLLKARRLTDEQITAGITEILESARARMDGGVFTDTSRTKH